MTQGFTPDPTLDAECLAGRTGINNEPPELLLLDYELTLIFS